MSGNKMGTTALRFLLLVTVAMLCLQPTSVLAATPSAVGQWSAVQTWPFAPVEAEVLGNGSVLFWPAGSQGDNPQLWDPSTGMFTVLPKAGYNIYCAGRAFLGNGQLFVSGGFAGFETGLPNASIYDPVQNTWTAAPNMNNGRCEPTTTTLSNGDILAMLGWIHSGTVDGIPQVWQVGPGKWRNLTNATLQAAPDPRLFQGPNGKVFDAGPGPATKNLDPTGTGKWSFVANTIFGSARPFGSAVMYAPGKVMILGGASPPTPTAEIIDLNTASPKWQNTSSMANSRRQLNAVVLPDGTVLAVGGSSGSGFDNSASPVFAAELWDPATGNWTTMASLATYRGYESVALLLPDGRVLAAGGSSSSGEIFSPPYLFKGTRPTISTAPSSAVYGQTFFVETPDASSIAKVSLLRLGSAFHSFDSGQRYVPLTFNATSTGLNVTAPPDGNVSPPGQYMLFILNSNGVPSVSTTIQISAAPPHATSMTPTSGTTNGGTKVTISGSGFIPGAIVTVGGLNATNVKVVSSSSVTANVPAGSAGAVDVTVTNPDYQSSTLSGAYQYISGNGISFVQDNARTPNSASSVTVPYQLAQIAGNFNIVVIGWNDTSASVASVSDTVGNTYARAGAIVTGTNLTQEIYYANGIIGAAAGSNSVTVQFNQSASFVDVRIFEYHGMSATVPVDAVAGASGTSFTSASGLVTTAFAKELVFAANTVSTKTLTPGSGFTPVMLTNFFDIVEHKVVTATGTFGATANLSANSGWVMQTVTFKAAVQ